METIPYRRSKLLVKTIPKGTLLFRILKNQKNDMRGVPIENDQRCLTPNFNVYFYPSELSNSMKKITAFYQTSVYFTLR